jgi:hypothetical protein
LSWRMDPTSAARRLLPTPPGPHERHQARSRSRSVTTSHSVTRPTNELR